jgi:hypothetical protein
MKIETPNPGSYTVVLERGAQTETESYTVSEPVAAIDPPTATNDSASVEVGQSADIDVLANDTGENRYLHAVGTPNGGSAAIVGGLVRYTAPPGAGTFNFTYTVRKGDGGATDGGEATGAVTVTVTAAPAAGQGAIIINVDGGTTRTEGSAGFLFKVTEDPQNKLGVRDPFFDPEYVWTFGDPGVFTRNPRDDFPWFRVYNDNGTRRVVCGPKYRSYDNFNPLVALAGTATAGPDGYEGPGNFEGYYSNVAKGPIVAHVYKAPGTYTVTCTMYIRGRAPISKTQQVTVRAASDRYSGTRTICVGNNLSGAPSGAQLVGSWSAARSAASGLGRARVLFQRGQSHSMDLSIPNGSFTEFCIGAYGSGGDPVLNGGFRSSNNGAMAEWGISGVHLKPTDYNPADPWNTDSHDRSTGVEKRDDSLACVYDCKISNMFNGMYLSRYKSRLIVSDVYCTSWFNYGIFVEPFTDRVGYAGFWSQQQSNTVHIPGKDGTQYPQGADHGPMRHGSGGEWVGGFMFDMESYNSWPSDNAIQPSIRYGRQEASSPEEGNFSAFRGYLGSMHGTGNSSSSTVKPIRHLYDMTYCLQSNSTDSIYAPAKFGMTFRNGLHIMADVSPPDGGGSALDWIITRPAPAKGGDDLSSMGNFGVSLYNCTIVDLRTGFSLTWGDTTTITSGGTRGGGSQVAAKFCEIGNNVIVKSGNAIDTGDGPFDTTIRWSREYQGRRLNGTTPDSDFVPPASNYAYYGLDTGSNAIGDASVGNKTPGIGNSAVDGAPITYFDWFMNPRSSANPSRGHIEPNLAS